MTYASTRASLKEIEKSKNHQLVVGDICDEQLVKQLLMEFQPDYIMHLAAETHVDQSIKEPKKFVETNILGTYTILECALAYWKSLEKVKKDKFRLLHISTDEVYGSLPETGSFSELSPYDPSSPYSATKAGSDHLVRAWHKTFGLPVLITNCSNNYGPFQFPEKLIPLSIVNAINMRPIPIYGDGLQIRDWLYVDDHARALLRVLMEGQVGDTYNIGSNNEWSNIEVVQRICNVLDERFPERLTKFNSHKNLVQFVKDRPGHDRRYAINFEKIQKSLSWKNRETFETGLLRTIDWYIDNICWVTQIKNNMRSE